MNSQTKDNERRIRTTRLFLLDLDGTMYRGDEPIPGARQFIERLLERRIHYVFLTNNSSHSAAEYVKKLARLSIPASGENVFTSGQAVGLYLSQKKPNARVFTVGTCSLVEELSLYGLMEVDGRGSVDFVVVGFDTELTYAKIETACTLIDCGVDYYATNPDFVCPIQENRSLPDCGSICFMIEQATGKKPYVIGKPRPEMVEFVCKKFSVAPGKTAIIGDRLYTDIAMGRNAGVLTICVLTGESSRADIERSAVKPDLIFESVDVLNQFFVGE